MRLSTLKRFLREDGIEELLELARIDSLSSSGDLQFYRYCKERMSEMQHEEIRPKPLLRLRDAYLEPWTGDHDRTTLEEACRLALRVGCVLRADCYRRAQLEATPAGREEFGDGVPGWLSEHVAPTPVEAAESRPRWMRS